MTADVELLPLPDELRYRYGYMEQAEHDVTVANYARANVAHATAAKDAEIEGLRAEVDQAQASARVWRRLAETCDARAERLAEALQNVLDRDAAGSTECGCITLSRKAEREYESGTCPHQKARAALHPTAAQGDEAASA